MPLWSPSTAGPLLRRGLRPFTPSFTPTTGPALSGFSLGNDGATSNAATMTMVIPATANVGDVAVLTVLTANTTSALTTPTGWNLWSAVGGDLNGTTSSNLLTRTLQAGDPGSTLTLTFAGNGKPVGVLRTYSGVTEAGLAFASAPESATTSPTVPTVSVPAGGLLDVSITFRASVQPGPSINAFGSPYTDIAQAATNAAQPNDTVRAAYAVSNAGGTLGGEAETASTSGSGMGYAVALPATNQLVSVVLSDAGTAVDALSVAATASLTDTGSAADSLSVTATADLSDTGSGADALAVVSAVPLADSGAAADVLTVAAAVPLADAGTGAESLSASVTLALTETGAGADALTVAPAVPLSDTGSGAESLTVAATASLSDSASTADALTVTAAAALVDAGSAVDALTVAAAVPLADTGTFADTLTVDRGGTPVSLADTGTATETLSIAVAAVLDDVATGADVLAITAALTLSDQATSVETLTISTAAVLTDAGTFTDTLTVDKGTPGVIVTAAVLTARTAAGSLAARTAQANLTARTLTAELAEV